MRYSIIFPIALLAGSQITLARPAPILGDNEPALSRTGTTSGNSNSNSDSNRPGASPPQGLGGAPGSGADSAPPSRSGASPSDSSVVDVQESGPGATGAGGRGDQDIAGTGSGSDNLGGPYGVDSTAGPSSPPPRRVHFEDDLAVEAGPTKRRRNLRGNQARGLPLYKSKSTEGLNEVSAAQQTTTTSAAQHTTTTGGGPSSQGNTVAQGTTTNGGDTSNQVNTAATQEHLLGDVVYDSPSEMRRRNFRRNQARGLPLYGTPSDKPIPKPASTPAGSASSGGDQGTTATQNPTTNGDGRQVRFNDNPVTPDTSGPPTILVNSRPYRQSDMPTSQNWDD